MMMVVIMMTMMVVQLNRKSEKIKIFSFDERIVAYCLFFFSF